MKQNGKSSKPCANWDTMRCPAGHNGMKKRQPTKAARQRVGAAYGSKKLYWHSTYGQIEVNERLFRQGSCPQRSFSASVAVRCRGVSAPLQRVVTDFGADHPFRQVSEKLQEHFNKPSSNQNLHLIGMDDETGISVIEDTQTS